MTHDLLVSTCAPRLGWWSECECGWISNGHFTEAGARDAHKAHVEWIGRRPPLR